MRFFIKTYSTYFLLLLLITACDDDLSYLPPLPPAQNEKLDSLGFDPNANEIIEGDEDLTGIRLLALGDSYTIGEGVTIDERWPVQLNKRIRQLGYDSQEPKIIARTGWTTLALKQGILNEQPDASYDFVGLLIGVNNQYRGLNINSYAEDFEELLNLAIELANGDHSKTFVLSIPDYSVTPFGQSFNPDYTAKEIDDYNEINRSITEAYDVEYFNITEISRRAEFSPSLIATDGLHPSGEMYSLWVDLIFPWYSSKVEALN